MGEVGKGKAVLCAPERRGRVTRVAGRRLCTTSTRDFIAGLSFSKARAFALVPGIFDEIYCEENEKQHAENAEANAEANSEAES